MRWNVKTKEEENSNASLLERIMRSRGLKEEDFNDFLNPLASPLAPPNIFSDIKKAKERILEAVENKELILIWGDFDCDGVTSTAILFKTLTALKANFDYIIPDREKMGHGLNTKTLLPYIAKKKPKVLITVDCGISDVKEISLLKNFKIDVILTDHHKAPEILPEAYAILNPKAPDSLDENLSVEEIRNVAELCGAGVAYKLAQALLEEIEDKNLKDEILALASIGTVADVVPLLYENRKITARGLEILNKGVHKGIKLLFQECEKTDEITSYDIAFILAPRINAAGRLATADAAFKLLTSEDEDEIKIAIKELNNYNNIRQNLCDTIYEEALDIISKTPEIKKQKGIILYNENWHIGIIGIVASKIVEKFYKPVFIITKDDDNMARCSIRGIKEYNIAQILDENAKYFEGHGGHSMAGGFSFDLNKFSIDTVKNAILSTLDSKEEVKIEGPAIDIDCILNEEEVTEELIESLKKLEPTGQENPSPVFGIKDFILQSKRTIGKDGSHVMFEAKKGNKIFSCIKWRQSDLPAREGEKFDLAFEAKLNTFRDETTIRLFAVDFVTENDLTAHMPKFYDHRMKSGILNSIEEYAKRPNVDLCVYAKKISTKTLLKNNAKLLENLYGERNSSADIMFFDYPSNESEFFEILKEGYSKIHLMKENFSQNIEDYIKQLIGILKFASNNKEGEISIKEASNLIGASENFVQIALDILEELGAIEILDVDKIKFINPPHFEQFSINPQFEILNEEFAKIIEFKKYIAQTDLGDIEKNYISF